MALLVLDVFVQFRYDHCWIGCASDVVQMFALMLTLDFRVAFCLFGGISK